MKIGVIVQGLFEKSDSIGFDAVFQYKILVNCGYDCKIYAEKSDKNIYTDIHIHSIENFYTDFNKTIDLVIYHFCDGWKEFDSFVIKNKEKFIVRWHNNTPPWFYIFKQKKFALRSLKGFEIIESFITHNVKIMTNSEFTSKQFKILGGKKEKTSVVYPGSRYLSNPPEKHKNIKKLQDNVINILFVGRFVAHKGHRNMIHVCNFLQKNSDYKVNLHIVGRGDESLYEYNDEIKNMSQKYNTKIYGEVTEKKLYELYDTADVFLFLSEHEGFGLPVFEAMSRNLPLVAWRTSALDELLENHPLAFKEFDIAKFASAIVALKNEQVTKSLLTIQEEISSIYSLSVVKSQLIACLEKKSTKNKENHFAKNKEYNDIKKEVDKLYTHYKNSEYHSGFLHDFSENFVSKYDLKAFKTFFEQEKENSTNSTKNLSKGIVNYIDIPYENFSTHFGKINRSSLIIPSGQKYKNHVIFGPYIDIQKGDYEFELFFNTEVGNSYQKLKIEIVSKNNGIICCYNRRIYNAKNLTFSIPSDDESFEIRVSVLEHLDKEIIFQKMRLKKQHQNKYNRFIKADIFSTHEGTIQNNTIDFPEKKYTHKDIVFGPYISMDKGVYALNMSFEGNENIYCHITITEKNNKIISKFHSNIKNITNKRFTLKKKTHDLEFRISVDGNFHGNISYTGCEIIKLDDTSIWEKLLNFWDNLSKKFQIPYS